MATLVVTIVALGAVGWFAYLVGSGSKRGQADPVPHNLSAAQTDDELETKRLDRALVAAVVTAGFLTLSMPIYYLGELDRQEGFVDEFHEASLERGHHVWDEFGCADCHGGDAGGGGASFLEERSQVNVASWAAPALNDIFYRYDRDEVRFWIVFGRANTPMPAWGLEGGGPLNTQQVEDLMNYIESFQIAQGETLLAIDGNVTGAATRLENSAASVEDQIDTQRATLATIRNSPITAPLATEIAERARAILDDPANQTIDTDGDGLSDAMEASLQAVSEEAFGLGFLPASLTLDPRNVETTTGTSDLAAANQMVSSLEANATSLTITAENQDVLLEQATFGLGFLEAARANEAWHVDLEGVASATFGGDVEKATRAVALFNAYCARCHTAGYSAGAAFQQAQGSGALGPSLRDGRALTQFLVASDMYDFLALGSEEGIGYGVNGVGSGKMPGFGNVLSADDLQLIVDYLRGPSLDGGSE